MYTIVSCDVLGRARRAVSSEHLQLLSRRRYGGCITRALRTTQHLVQVSFVVVAVEYEGIDTYRGRDAMDFHECG